MPLSTAILIPLGAMCPEGYLLQARGEGKFGEVPFLQINPIDPSIFTIL